MKRAKPAAKKRAKPKRQLTLVQVKARQLSGLRVALSRIGDIIRQSPQGRDVVAVLRAMRGPDDENRHVKSVTTVPIRYAAFGKFVGGYFGMCDKGRVTEAAIESAGWVAGTDHFECTVSKAARALGIYVAPKGGDE